MPTLQLQKDSLTDAAEQVRILEDGQSPLPLFDEKLSGAGLAPLAPLNIDTFQINVGKLCNQTCSHCHVDAGPDRREVMSQETMQDTLLALDRSEAKVVDITGGAPEMNPHFQWLVEQVAARGHHILVRCNLTIIVASKRFSYLPQFYRQHGVEVISSLPYFEKGRTDRQRGDGVFEQSIKALQRLNEVGYGLADDLQLNLVYNPAGAFLPGDQKGLEQEFRRILKQRHGIDFHNLYTITNMPISRFLKYLLVSGNYEEYMQRLVTAFNPAAAQNVMCRTMISIGWDGFLYDCDFNQMLLLNITDNLSFSDSSASSDSSAFSASSDSSALSSGLSSSISANGHRRVSERGLSPDRQPAERQGLPLHRGAPLHVRDFDQATLTRRLIRTGRHCFGCTAGLGSSCAGATA